MLGGRATCWAAPLINLICACAGLMSNRRHSPSSGRQGKFVCRVLAPSSVSQIKSKRGLEAQPQTKTNSDEEMYFSVDAVSSWVNARGKGKEKKKGQARAGERWGKDEREIGREKRGVGAEECMFASFRRKQQARKSKTTVAKSTFVTARLKVGNSTRHYVR